MNQQGLKSNISDDVKARLSSVHVLIIDSDIRIASLVRRILESFGFKKIYIVKSGDEGVSTLKEKPIDMVITEWPMRPEGDMDFVQFIRKNGGDDKQIPIILLTGRAEMRDVKEARDSGVTEFVVKPFSAKTLSNRIIRVIENPRNFVESNGYVGPDRRRRDMGDEASDKRMSFEEMQKFAVKDGDDTIYKIHGQNVRISPPRFTIKEKIGKDIDVMALFNEDSVAEAQRVIMESCDEFMEWVVVDVARLDSLYKKLEHEPNSRAVREELVDIAMSIKSQAGIFEYDLATLVGKSLADYLEEVGTMTKEILMVVRKHIDIIYVIFHKQMSGAGGDIGQDLLKSLEELKKKHH